MAPFLFVIFQHRAGCHLFSATAIAAFSLGRFFDVLVLTLLFLANAPHIFLLSWLVHLYLLRCYWSYYLFGPNYTERFCWLRVHFLSANVRFRLTDAGFSECRKVYALRSNYNADSRCAFDGVR